MGVAAAKGGGRGGRQWQEVGRREEERGNLNTYLWYKVGMCETLNLGLGVYYIEELGELNPLQLGQ